MPFVAGWRRSRRLQSAIRSERSEQFNTARVGYLTTAQNSRCGRLCD